jgi:polar amino acid transport system substrate-binding protein
MLVAKRRQLTKLLENHITLLQDTFNLANDSILILSDHNQVFFMNKSMKALLNLKRDEKLSKLDNIPQIQIQKKWIYLDQLIAEEKSNMVQKVFNVSKVPLKIEKENSVVIDLHLSTVSIGEKYYYIIVMQDLADRQRIFEMQNRHVLTDLPNQEKALSDLPILFSKIHTENKKIGLVLFSFDNFSRLRSIVGLKQSNEIIIKFANYLRKITVEMKTDAYHTFDNHFLLMLSNVESIESITSFIVDIQKKLATFYKIENSNLHLTISAGVAIYPDSGSTRQLLDNAYKALVKAEQGGDGAIEIFLPQKQSKYDELTLHNDMESGLKKGEFEVYYQPIVEADTHQVVSAEALIRWIHPTYGFIPPDIFIGLMEKTGFIIKLGRFILNEVLKQQKRWELFKFKQIGISINVSMVEIETGEFVKYVEEQLQYHQVNPELIKFEITEGKAMLNEGKTKKYFMALKRLGVSILLDDFGTGYTSFTYLKQFPADIIKIDKTLVDHILENNEDQRIIKAMIDLGHNLGMKIVVEGVENKEMVTMLNSFNCDFIQGYYFSKPLPVFEFQKLIRRD